MKYTDDYDDDYDDDYSETRDNKYAARKKYNPDARKRIEDRLEKKRLKQLCSDIYRDDLNLD